jgi:uncharacterized membrane protein YgdD (TMEM256/DUF423 family)
MARPSSLLVALAGLLGAAGVTDAALAAHVAGGDTLQRAAEILMVHGATLLGLAALVARSGERWTLAVAAGFLGAGAALFGADVTLLTLQGHRLFPYAAPIGGSTMISAWLVVGLLALAGHLEPRARD